MEHISPKDLNPAIEVFILINMNKELRVIQTVDSTKYTEDELLKGKSKDGSLCIDDVDTSAEFVTGEGEELYVYFSSEELDAEVC